jgi:hypothetical protein
MYKTIAAAFAVSSIVFVTGSALADGNLTPTPAPVQLKYGGEHRGKLEEEIRLNEQRARELEPAIARDTQAREDLHKEAAVLERHAKAMHERAEEFRNIARSIEAGPQRELLGFAKELDTFAVHDEENARAQHELAKQLEGIIKQEQSVRDWHLEIARRLKAHLASNS